MEPDRSAPVLEADAPRASDPFGGVPEAPRARRLAAGALDALAVLGNPWLVLLLCVAFVIPVIELIPVALAPILLSLAGAATTWVCTRLPNGERLSAGSLASGLTVLRTMDAGRAVLANDVEGPLRPTARRVVGGRIGLACTTLAAIITIGSCGWTVWAIASQSANQAAVEARWKAEEVDASKLSWHSPSEGVSP